MKNKQVIKTAEELAAERIQSIWATWAANISGLCAEESGYKLQVELKKLLPKCLPELKKVLTDFSQELRCEAVNVIRKTEVKFGKLISEKAYWGIDSEAALGSLLTDVAKTLEKELKNIGK